jgi:hypothetical protein
MAKLDKKKTNIMNEPTINTGEKIIWDIAADEWRADNQKVLFLAVAYISLIMLVVAIAMAIAYPNSFSEAFRIVSYGFVFILIAALFYFFLNKIYPYPKRHYELGPDGLKISKGKKEGFYNWEDFEYFSNYIFLRRGRENADDPPKVGKKKKDTEGQLYFLAKNNPRRAKTYVFIYSKSDNFELVEGFLKKYLQQRLLNDDPRLAKCEFD